MPKLLLTIIMLCIIYTSCIIPTYTGKSTLKETGVSKTDIKITRVLVVGVGSTASRLFMENLSTELIKLFTRSQIQCDFSYEGKIPRGTHINLENIFSSQYDTYLVLNPVDTSYINTQKNVAFFETPLPGGYGATGNVIGNQYKEDYYVELYANNDTHNKVWQAELKVDFDVANPDKYKKIAKEIFNNLLKHAFIGNK